MHEIWNQFSEFIKLNADFVVQFNLFATYNSNAAAAEAKKQIKNTKDQVFETIARCWLLTQHTCIISTNNFTYYCIWFNRKSRYFVYFFFLYAVFCCCCCCDCFYVSVSVSVCFMFVVVITIFIFFFFFFLFRYDKSKNLNGLLTFLCERHAKT